MTLSARQPWKNTSLQLHLKGVLNSLQACLVMVLGVQGWYQSERTLWIPGFRPIPIKCLQI